MSKDNGNLRLLGSPVNLSYRNKKKDDKKNSRNRPRSALQSSSVTNENTEKYKRPFSADTKDRAQSTRNFLNTFNVELQSNNMPNNIKVFPPTTDILGDSKTSHKYFNKDFCSNASDYGSEDTFISLGTKIKNKAQLTPKNKPSNVKNFLKYRNIMKKARRPMENCTNECKTDQNYGFNIKITEKSSRASSPLKDYDEVQVRSMSPTTRPPGRSISPNLKNKSYESYFIPMEAGIKYNKHDLAGRVSFGPSSVQAEVEQAIDTYSQRLTATKQQLSLVEEESTQDLDSIPSQNLSSLSPENSLEDQKNKKKSDVQDNLNSVTFIADIRQKCPKATNNFVDEVRTYTNFYDDFNANTTFKDKMTSSVNTDSASKDSGYHESGINDEKPYKMDFSLPTTSFTKRSNSLDKLEDQPKSLDSASTTSNDKSYHKTFPLDKKAQWVEPLNHSRLLYKNFFLKKEGHIAVAPENSPVQKIAPETSKPNEVNETFEYPSYLIHSSTKAYTSKVIEDYKKELQAINNLHELTLKDIKTDAISPTPLNIDKMFEQISSNSDDNVDKKNKSTNATINKNQQDISKISTKELIQNYFKVKEGDIGKDYIPKNLENFDKTNNNYSSSKDTSRTNKQIWNNNCRGINNANVTKQSQKNVFSMKTPLSARIDSVQNDKDVDSWMSMTVLSPRGIELDKVNETQPSNDTNKIAVTELEDDNYSQNKDLNEISTDKPQAKDLTSNSTVLDIYSMLKEIESYGDHPVMAVTNVSEDKTNNEKDNEKIERCTTPKDNFMEILEFLEKVEQSANEALSVVTSTAPATIPKLEVLLKLPQTELAQRLVTASLQLEERSCCIALLQESLANHKEQMINKVSNLEKQSHRNISKVKQECEEAIKRHQSFIDQLINDKKTLNHRIEQLVDERRTLEERWKRSAQALEERYKLELRNQHDKMAAAQQVARQRWVRQKAEKIKELTVKGLEGELREMAERQQQEISSLRMSHAEECARMQARRTQDLDELRATLDKEKEDALLRERHLATSRLEKQILELESSHQEQRTRLVSELRAENERAAAQLTVRERQQRDDIEKWRKEQEEIIEEKRVQMERGIAKQREDIEAQMNKKQEELEEKFEQYKREFEAEQNVLFKKRVTDISSQHKLERDREIEKAIESMEAEAQTGRKELQEAIRRNKEQHEAELRALAATEQATLRRHQDAQARLRRAEDACAELEVTVGQLEVRNKVLVEKNTQLEAQTQEIRTSCEESWSMKMENMKREIETMKKTHEEQMHQLYAKVKVAVSRKDSAIQALTRESAKYQEKVTLLEQKLQQQRKDFLKHKYAHVVADQRSH